MDGVLDPEACEETMVVEGVLYNAPLPPEGEEGGVQEMAGQGECELALGS